MRSLAALCLFACAAVFGCGGAASSEGGVTGTGVNASITGNVTMVVEDAAAQQATALPFSIRVRIEEAPGVESTTDDDGAFALTGAFAGLVTLRFANAESGADIGALALEVPAGSETIVENIVIRPHAPQNERVRAAAVRQLDVFARADLVECNADGTGALFIRDDGRPPRQFMVRLLADTEIERRDGTPLTCADIGAGSRVGVEGVLLADRTIAALRVVVGAVRPPGPGPEPHPEHVRGVVLAVNCPRGVFEVRESRPPEPVTRLVRLTAATAILCGDTASEPCPCDDIRPGDRVAVEGTIEPRRPGVVTADRVTVASRPTAVEVVGTIVRLGCEADALTVRPAARGERPLLVLIGPETQFACLPSGRPCACADLRVADTVMVGGRRLIDRPQVIDADQVTVVRRRRVAP